MLHPLLKYRLKQSLKKLQHKTGLMSASNIGSTTGYDKAWIRDNVYEALGLEKIRDYEAMTKVYNGLFDIFIKHESKIDNAISNDDISPNEYIHPRYCPVTLEQLPGDWAFKQHDSIGAFLFKVGDLEEKGLPVIRDDADLRIIRKLVLYLGKIEYWHNPDSGMWEQEQAVHASSVGACLAGLEKIGSLIRINRELIDEGRKALDALLPYETEDRGVDLALLSLIYPYKIVSDEQKALILRNVETHLVRDKGLIRFEGDLYYHNGHEAEWTFGFSWLAVIYKESGDRSKYTKYLKKMIETFNHDGHVPELYLGRTESHNENAPLGWSIAMAICALS